MSNVWKFEADGNIYGDAPEIEAVLHDLGEEVAPYKPEMVSLANKYSTGTVVGRTARIGCWVHQVRGLRFRRTVRMAPGP